MNLRTLLVVMLVLCLVVGGITQWAMDCRHQAQLNRDRVEAAKQSFAWIKEMGGQHDVTIKKLRSQTWLEELFEDPGGVDEPAVVIVMSNVQLIGTPVTDADLEHLKGRTNLQMLYLFGTQSTDAGLEYLKGLTSLEYLNLDSTRVTDAGLSELHVAFPNCDIGGDGIQEGVESVSPSPPHVSDSSKPPDSLSPEGRNRGGYVLSAP